MWRGSVGCETIFQSHISLDIFQIYVTEIPLLERIVVFLEFQLVSVWLRDNAVGIIAFSVYLGALYRKVNGAKNYGVMMLLQASYPMAVQPQFESCVAIS